MLSYLHVILVKVTNPQFIKLAKVRPNLAGPQHWVTGNWPNWEGQGQQESPANARVTRDSAVIPR